MIKPGVKTLRKIVKPMVISHHLSMVPLRAGESSSIRRIEYTYMTIPVAGNDDGKLMTRS